MCARVPTDRGSLEPLMSLYISRKPRLVSLCVLEELCASALITE